MERYYQKEIECASQEQIKAWQDERLVRQVRHVWDKVPYYRAKMEEKGVTPEDIHGRDDLYKLPFLSKADLRDAYPFGLLAEPLEKCVRIHSTSGTTGKRVVACYTRGDIDLWEDCCARAIAAAGGTAEQADAAQRYADALGLAFQIRDDMLDVIGDEATFGKPIGSDKAEKKTTFVDLLGLAACEREVVRLTDEAISALGLFGGEADFLAALSHSMETRNK